MSATDYTDPTTINVDTVIGNITHAAKMRRDQWDARLLWPNVTVLALANEVMVERQRVAELETALDDVLGTTWPPLPEAAAFERARLIRRSVLAAGHSEPDPETRGVLDAERIIRRALDAADGSTPPDTIAENAAYALKTHGVLAAPETYVELDAQIIEADHNGITVRVAPFGDGESRALPLRFYARIDPGR